MRRRVLVPLICLVGSSPLPAGDVRLGVGVFSFAPRGADVQLSYQLGEGPWTVGFRHVQWMDTFHDPFTGRALSETTETRTGPLVTYLFRPKGPGSWYVGGAVYQWKKAEKSLVYGDISHASTTAPLLGGGYTRTFGTWFYWNTGMYLGPGKRLHTQTSTGSEDDSGVFDIQVQVGVRFPSR